MKSSYELAMERFADKNGESKPVTEELKATLAAIDEKFKAKIAERELFLTPKLAAAQAMGKRSDAEDIRKQLASEKTRLEEERESAKEAARNAK